MTKILFSVLILTILSSTLCSIQDYQQSPQEFADFISGVNTGFGFFTGLPYGNLCKTYDGKGYDLAREIFFDLLRINVTNAVSILKLNIPRALVLIEIIAKQNISCSFWSKELRKIADKMISRTNQNNYAQETVNHALANMNQITDMTVVAVRDYFARNYINSGRVGGELMRFIYFWIL